MRFPNSRFRMALVDRRSLSLFPVLLTLLTAAGVSAQTRSAIAIPPLADSTVERIHAEVRVPEGFSAGIFAAPPHLTYPTCLAPAGPGVLFVCTDPNLLFGRDRHRGRILRFVDEELDGTADRYTVFADSLDSVRGIAFDAGSVYVMHAPTLAAYRDTDGDGVADERDVLVQGLGFGLDDRNGDHTSNGLRLGADGWIYVAVGDYGFLDATGTDGSRVYLHGGGVVRVRPDGSELEIVARGTRNIYDIALDTQLRIFARDNNNNGQGWNSRFHYLPAGADAGYPSRFRNFPDEIHPALADFGAGAATTTLWIDEPTFPEPLRQGLVSADWALNRVYAHELSPEGATFRIDQREVIEIPRPVDLEVASTGDLYIASLAGGSYDYAGEHVGYVLRLRPAGAAAPGPALASVDDGALVDVLLSEGRARRHAAQRELLARGMSTDVRRRLGAALANEQLPVGARTMALLTLKQAIGAEATPELVDAVADPELRAMALFALADRREAPGVVPIEPFVRSLRDPDPFVRLQAVRGIARIAPADAGEHLIRMVVDPDPTVAHLAENQLASLADGAVRPALAALDGNDPRGRAAALRVLARIHDPVVVSHLIDRLTTADGERRRAIVGALARLYHREGSWDGSWWGNQPPTEGPYFAPVEWGESVRIGAALAQAVGAGSDEERRSLAPILEIEAVIPRESAGLLSNLDRLPVELRDATVDALLGGRDVAPATGSLLVKLAAGGEELREAALRVVVADPAPPATAADLIRAAASDADLGPELRARALAAAAHVSPAPPPERVAGVFAAVIPELEQHPPLRQAWLRYVNDRARADEIDEFARLAASGDPDERVLGYAVLVQMAGFQRTPEAARARAAEIVASAWRERSSAAPLARAIEVLEVADRYADELERYRAGS